MDEFVDSEIIEITEKATTPWVGFKNCCLNSSHQAYRQHISKCQEPECIMKWVHES